MEPITKDQAEYIRKRSKELKVNTPQISMSCRDKSKGKRKKRYLTIDLVAIRFLKEHSQNCMKVIYDSSCPEKYKNK